MVAKRNLFLGIPFDDVDLSEATDHVMNAAGSPHFSYVVTPNVDHLVMLLGRGDEIWRRDYRLAVADAGLRINDSRVLMRLARISGNSLRPVPGSDLTRCVVERLAGGEAGIALIGGRSHEAEWLRSRLPDATVHHLEPPMGVRDDDAAQQAIVEFVVARAPDIVFLAMGAPQSELVAARIGRHGSARGVGLCIGASIEFLSGAQRRAPLWVQRSGFEWAFRLLREPRRLWRRYLVEGPRIFLHWLRWRRNPQDINQLPMSPRL